MYWLERTKWKFPISSRRREERRRSLFNRGRNRLGEGRKFNIKLLLNGVVGPPESCREKIASLASSHRQGGKPIIKKMGSVHLSFEGKVCAAQFHRGDTASGKSLSNISKERGVAGCEKNRDAWIPGLRSLHKNHASVSEESEGARP